MNMDTGEIKQESELSQEEKDSGKWKPEERTRSKRQGMARYTKGGPSRQTAAERKAKRKLQRAARKRQRA